MKTLDRSIETLGVEGTMYSFKYNQSTIELHKDKVIQKQSANQSLNLCFQSYFYC